MAAADPASLITRSPHDLGGQPEGPVVTGERELTPFGSGGVLHLYRPARHDPDRTTGTVKSGGGDGLPAEGPGVGAAVHHRAAPSARHRPTGERVMTADQLYALKEMLRTGPLNSRY
jgi:hypothetical protein